MATLKEILEKHTAEGELYEKLGDGRLRCMACAHRCRIREGSAGVCKVRFNKAGVLRVPFGYVSGTQCDPVEKKPFFHAHPGSLAFSFGMLGCDLHCGYCQNWVTSQALRDPRAVSSPMLASPDELIELARKQGAEIVVSTYNEPLITSEWAAAIFKEAKNAAMITAYVSNGNATSEVLRYLQPCLDLFKVDLKSFNDRRYRQLGGRLQPVLDSIRFLHSMGVWVEVVTLLVPGYNDSEEELTKLTEFLADVSPDIPWHVTAFYKNYRMTDPENTTNEGLLAAAEIGKKSGVRYIYAGNLPGGVGHWEHTRCHRCGKLLIKRYGYQILSYSLTAQGCCPSCKTDIPGRWAETFQPQISAYPYSIR
jgi:pyruvate formate lyase activating enzyme